MTAYQVRKTPLEFQINSKVTESDYLALRERSRNERLTQAELIRLAVRQYLNQKPANPPTAQEAC